MQGKSQRDFLGAGGQNRTVDTTLFHVMVFSQITLRIGLYHLHFEESGAYVGLLLGLTY